MKILLVNTYDKGGAANSCLRLHKEFIKTGVESRLLLRFSEKDIPFAEVAKPRVEIRSVIQNYIIRIQKKLNILKKRSNSEKDFILKKRSKNLEIFSFPESEYDLTRSESYKEADIINLHWVADFLDYSTFFNRNKKPIVWTLHDINPFSGGVHYNEEFLGMDESGFPLRRIRSEEELKIEASIIKIKKKSIKKIKNLIIVAPSKWLAKEAAKSDCFNGRPIHYIPNGLDSQSFKPKDQKLAREMLGLPPEKKILLFVADSLGKNRKGFLFLKKAIERLKNHDIILCAIGDKPSEFDSLGNLIALGSIQDEQLICAAYSAADVFVIPSLMDNLPNTVLEALMCGTPVIGFPIGGIPDMVKDGFNGILTDEVSVPSLVMGIERFLKMTTPFNKEKIRKDTIANYDISVQVKKYKELYSETFTNSFSKQKTYVDP